MEEKQSRIRWNDEELQRLAAAMAPCLLADPRLHPLDAVRVAQECLDPARRRELKAWSLVEGRLQPRLDEALAALRERSSRPQDGLPTSSTHEPGGDAEAERPDGQRVPRGDGELADRAEAAAAEPSGDAGAMAVEQPQADERPEPGDDAADGRDASPAPASDAASDAAAEGSAEDRLDAVPPAAGASKRDEPARVPAVPDVEPLRIEAALVAALQSPAVEDALVELFARTMSKALLRASAGEPGAAAAPVPRPAAERRVLLAGFADGQQRSLADALGGTFEVRTWKPANGPQLFETLVRLCRIVVFPEDADDEADAGLKALGVQVLRHDGNAGRLAERIAALD